MNDEVSVAELLEREGWTGAQARSKGNLRVLAVMLAVVLGCGLAALLVHIGPQAPKADAPSPFDVPHGPTGGLAGGGVPPNPPRTEQTRSGSSVVVTNQAGPVLAGVPWTTPRPAPSSEPATSTDPSVTSTTDPGSETSATTTAGPPGGNDSSSPGNRSSPSTPPRCPILFLFC